jgi:hypothetical protein
VYGWICSCELKGSRKKDVFASSRSSERRECVSDELTGEVERGETAGEMTIVVVAFLVASFDL